jgi:RNA polymerase sigma factor (sigma-70 family)
VITDEALYLRLMAGDEGALEALVHRYHANLFAFLYRQTSDRHLAEDLMQEAWTRLVIYQGEPPRAFRAWAFTIVANLVRDHYRSAYQRRVQSDPFESWGESNLVDEGPGADELLLRDDDRREVVEALQQLNPAQREVLVLRFYHSMKLDEIAEVTDAPLGSVKSRLFHGLRQMKAHLGREGVAVRCTTI